MTNDESLPAMEKVIRTHSAGRLLSSSTSATYMRCPLFCGVVTRFVVPNALSFHWLLGERRPLQGLAALP